MHCAMLTTHSAAQIRLNPASTASSSPHCPSSPRSPSRLSRPGKQGLCRGAVKTWPGMDGRAARAAPGSLRQSPRQLLEALISSQAAIARYGSAVEASCADGRRVRDVSSASPPPTRLQVQALSQLPFPTPCSRSRSKMKFEITDDQVRGATGSARGRCSVLPRGAAVLPLPLHRSLPPPAGAAGQRPGVRRLQHLCHCGANGQGDGGRKEDPAGSAARGSAGLRTQQASCAGPALRRRPGSTTTPSSPRPSPGPRLCPTLRS